MERTAAPEKELLGGLGATAVVAGAMIGVGIFLTPRLVALELGRPSWFLLAWLAGGVVAMAGASAYAELGVLFPRAGGDYVYLRHAYGPSVGFAGGWLLLAGVFGGSIASMSVAVCQYQLPVLLAVDLERPLLGGMEGYRWCALSLVLALTLVNSLGLRPSAILQTAATLIPVAVLIGVALYALPRPAVPSEPAATADRLAFTGVTAAFLQVYFAYAGWNAISYLGSEVKEARRHIPLALLGGTGLVTALYLLLAWTFLRVLGIDELTRTFEAGTACAARLFGAAAERPVAALIAIALIGSINATVLGGARIAYAMGKERHVWRRLSRRSARTGAPAAALWALAGFCTLLIASGTFQQLVELTSVAMLFLGGLAVLSVYVLRRREPDRPRAVLAPGYPWFPAFYLAASALVLSLRVSEAWREGEDASARPWFPLLGLLLFALLWSGHRLHRR